MALRVGHEDREDQEDEHELEADHGRHAEVEGRAGDGVRLRAGAVYPDHAGERDQVRQLTHPDGSLAMRVSVCRSRSG